MKNYKICLSLVILFLFSCQTNKIPSWVTEPPEDDDISIYIVGHGVNNDPEEQIKASFESVIDQLYSRFEIPSNNYLNSTLDLLLEEAYKRSLTDFEQKISILDKWNNDENLYILVRINRSFFTPIIELYANRYDEMIDYSHESETLGDKLLTDGEMFKSFDSYLTALGFMLDKEDEFYSHSILDIMDKIYSLVDSIEYRLLESFDTLTIDYPIQNRLLFEVNDNSNKDYNGFSYKISFTEGWDSRVRVTTIPIRDNFIEFIPPKPLKSGTSEIITILNIDELFNVFTPWQNNHNLESQIGLFKTKLEKLLEESKTSIKYNVKSDLQSIPKLIAFKNGMVLEGVNRFLLDKGNPVEVTPQYQLDEPLQSYLRELDRITDGFYNYLIIGDEIKEVIETQDDQILIKLTGSFSLIDIRTSKILKTESVSAEYSGELGSESFAYLSYGLEVGKIIHELKF
ncbi:MAG: hypothetical protein OCD02_05950 [Spirochaetaceae bacterium]